MFKTTLIVFVLITYVLGDERPIIKTPNGVVRGVYRKSNTGQQYVAFLGIPYAKPPVGELRFKSPVPIEPWTGIWEADTEYICMQRDHEPSDKISIFGNEDCLYINVYTPRISKEKTSFDVIVHIHGGGFSLGHGNLCGPNLIIDRDIVFVTFNYRLGALGFLATEDEASPGNYGLKDQSLALKWIQDNIKSFGGNPDSVTINGLSAGAASVHLHYLSPLSRNLFHRGISVSGTALNNWALVKRPLENARILGQVVGCEQKSSHDLVDCLKKKPSKQLAKASKKLQPWLYNPFSPFGPVVEPDSPEAFISAQPYDIINNGFIFDLPWISTVTKDEGLYPATDYLYNKDRLPYLEKNWDKLAPFILNYYGSTKQDSWAEIAQKVRSHYLENQTISLDTFDGLVRAIGDRLFISEAQKAARMQAQVNKAPVYFSVFGYRGDHSITERFTRSTHNFGVCHADDILYTLSVDPSWFQKYMSSENDKKMSKILIDMWLDFASTSKPKLPQTKWEAVSRNKEDPLKLLFIADPDNLIMKETKDLGNTSFWESLPLKENEKFISLRDEL